MRNRASSRRQFLEDSSLAVAMTGLTERLSIARAAGTAGTGIGLADLSGPCLWAADLAEGAPNAETIGWRVGCQT